MRSLLFLLYCAGKRILPHIEKKKSFGRWCRRRNLRDSSHNNDSRVHKRNAPGNTCWMELIVLVQCNLGPFLLRLFPCCETDGFDHTIKWKESWCLYSWKTATWCGALAILVRRRDLIGSPFETRPCPSLSIDNIGWNQRWTAQGIPKTRRWNKDWRQEKINKKRRNYFRLSSAIRHSRMTKVT